MATHGMIDLETLGVEPDSVIMTLGAVKFDPFSDTEPHTPLYLRVDVEEQSEKYNRTIDENTLAWWCTCHQSWDERTVKQRFSCAQGVVCTRDTGDFSGDIQFRSMVN